jgi:hypothetical protein
LDLQAPTSRKLDAVDALAPSLCGGWPPGQPPLALLHFPTGHQSPHASPTPLWRRFYGAKDDLERFLFFSRAALEWLTVSGKQPDIIHLHDWQSAAVVRAGAGRWPMGLGLGVRRCRQCQGSVDRQALPSSLVHRLRGSLAGGSADGP